MIKSKSKRLLKLVVPEYSEDKELIMLPINLEGGNKLPYEFREYASLVIKMIKLSPIKKGIAYLTIHAKKVEAESTHRRGGPHSDGNYFPVATTSGWGNTAYQSAGWKVGENGPPVTTDYHKKSYCSNLGGMLIISTHSLCKGWLGKINGNVGVGGDASKLTDKLNKLKSFILKPNTLYLSNSQFIHESLPSSRNINRVLVRITLPDTEIVL